MQPPLNNTVPRLFASPVRPTVVQIVRGTRVQLPSASQLEGQCSCHHLDKRSTCVVHVPNMSCYQRRVGGMLFFSLIAISLVEGTAPAKKIGASSGRRRYTQARRFLGLGRVRALWRPGLESGTPIKACVPPVIKRLILLHQMPPREKNNQHPLHPRSILS